MNNVDAQFFYAHSMNPDVLNDMGIESTALPALPPKAKFLNLGDTIFINTWIGAYFDTLKVPNECTLRFNYEMWRSIYWYINENFPGTDLIMDHVERYYPFVNYSNIHRDEVENFVSKEPRKKILVSNGPCHSNQCAYDGNMENIINALAAMFPDKVFIATSKFDTVQPNVFFTSNIITTKKCDLNEISYLSNSCGLVIGRNSGPYCFSVTDVNINNPNKTFYAFGERETDSFMHGLPTKAKFVFEKFTSQAEIFNTMIDLVREV